MEQSWARLDVALAVLQLGARLLQLFELATQLLAVFVQLLQRFIAVHKITIRGFTKLHVINALMGQLLILILKYLTGIFLPVHDILQISL
jgi:hypothetical protein